MSLQPSSSGHLPGPQSLRTGLLTWTAWEDRTYWVGCLAPLRMRAGQNVGNLPRRSCQMRSVSAYPGWDISRWKLCLETLPSLDRARMTENNIHLVEVVRNIIPDHDLILSTKDVTPRNLQQLTTTLSNICMCTPIFIAALFIIARTWKQPRCPSADEWIRKLWYMYKMEYYSAIKKNTFESVLMMWMKMETIIQSEISQKEKHQ